MNGRLVSMKITYGGGLVRTMSTEATTIESLENIFVCLRELEYRGMRSSEELERHEESSTV
jgi:hypothetical protein